MNALLAKLFAFLNAVSIPDNKDFLPSDMSNLNPNSMTMLHGFSGHI